MDQTTEQKIKLVLFRRANPYNFTQEQLAVCKEFIEHFYTPIKKMSRRATAYQYKHLVEYWAGIYIPFEAFVTAAVELGFQMEQTSKRNVWHNFGLKIGTWREHLCLRQSLGKRNAKNDAQSYV
jgi:hypothetical protein